MSRKTEFASSWWAQRWIRVLERFGWSARLNRGRSYARHGNVLDLDIQPGLVRAKVQGSRKQPYRVEIGMKPINRGDWNRVIALLRRKAIYAARLLSGEMPRDIEEIFKAADVPLFPQSGGDLIMSCTCPDWASPCKHVAAAYYVLGSEFDRDPFLLFELRGRSKEQVLAALRGQRPERAPSARAPRVVSEPLEEHLTDFWEAGDELDDITIRVTPAPVPQAILKRLGPIPLRDLPEEWNSDIARMYEVVSKDALAFVNLSGSVQRVPAMNPRINAGRNENGNGHEPEETQYHIVQEHAAEGAEDDAPGHTPDGSEDAESPTAPESRSITPLEIQAGVHTNGEPDPSAVELLPDPMIRADVADNETTFTDQQSEEPRRRRSRWPIRRNQRTPAQTPPPAESLTVTAEEEPGPPESDPFMPEIQGKVAQPPESPLAVGATDVGVPAPSDTPTMRRRTPRVSRRKPAPPNEPERLAKSAPDGGEDQPLQELSHRTEEPSDAATDEGEIQQSSASPQRRSVQDSRRRTPGTRSNPES